MEFVFDGRTYALSKETVRARLRDNVPEPVQTHWADVDGRRWPIKQAFRIATGISDPSLTSHRALIVLRRLGFVTSSIGDPASVTSTLKRAPTPAVSHDEAVAAFTRVDRELNATSLTGHVASLEALLLNADRTRANEILADTGFDDDLVESALRVRERIGMIDTLIHAAVITQTLPLILEPGEVITNRPSLGAGNDVARNYDLETSVRVAEFKLSSWKGADGMRKRGVFADVVGLSMDRTGRRRQVFVVGPLPGRYLSTSRQKAVGALSKAALKLRGAGIDPDMSVAEFTRQAQVEVVDLTTLIPHLR